MSVFGVIRGRRKRAALAAALRHDRLLSGRRQRARHYRPGPRKALTRAQALWLFQWNRRLTAGCRRADRAFDRTRRTYRQAALDRTVIGTAETGTDGGLQTATMRVFGPEIDGTQRA